MRAMIIVESKAKTHTIGKIVGDDYLVRCCLGHVYDLPENSLGVDIKNGFQPKYVQLKEKRNLIKDLETDAKNVGTIILATDPDREGESIAWHLKGLFPGKKIYRMRFNEITYKAVRDALKNLTNIDQRLVDAQQARRILDRLVGYKISPLLRRGFSAGRVQSVALRLICEREKEIQAFVTQESWKLTAQFGRLKSDETFKALFIGMDKNEVKLQNETEAEHYHKELIKHKYHVEKITRKEEKRRPYPPYTTSTLQQDAARRLGFTIARTMTVAQQLYEGIDLGGTDGTTGLITYMRTDSVRISSEAQQEAREVISQKYGEQYLPATPPHYAKKGKKGATTQDAHEAIHPTSAHREPSKVAKLLKPEQLKLYTLIWNRFIASQMNPARVEVVRVDIANGSALFRATGTTVKFDGFMRAYSIASETDEEEKEETLPDLQEGESLRLDNLKATQHFTKPPPRYNEGSLIRTLEEKGIGRPSTYVPTVETLKKRGYVQMDKRTFSPTTAGFIVTKLLTDNFEDIMDYDFTARMEGTLDDVETGEVPWVKVVENFYDTFSQDLENTMKNLEITCEKCGSQMALREGNYGLFYACANYPKCKNTKSFTGMGTAEPKPTDQKCEKCGAPMVVREGKRGAFLACSAYPKCKNAKSLAGMGTTEDAAENNNRASPKPTDKKCEKCGAPMVVREGRRGAFLACSAYPKCKNTKSLSDTGTGKEAGENIQRASPKPTDQKCEKCGAPMVLREGRYGAFLACSAYPECRNSKPYIGDLACPRKGCDGKIIKKVTKKRKMMYGCTRYPDCDFATWFAPVDAKCPHCGTFIIRKKVKDDIIFQCASDECGKEIDKKYIKIGK